MTDINLKTLTPDTSLPTTGFLFGADSQASTNPSVYSTQTVATTLLGSTSLTSTDPITTSAPLLNLTQAWNSSGTTFTGLRFNVDTTTYNQSAAASLLMDLQVGGTSQFRVRKDGRIFTNGNITTYAGGEALTLDAGGMYASTYYKLSAAGYIWFDPDAYMRRRGTANIQLGLADAAAPVAQTLSVQSVVAGQTNVAGANFTINGSQGTGSGAGGSIIFQVAPAGGSGSAQNALATALTINSTAGLSGWTIGGSGGISTFTSTGNIAQIVGGTSVAINPGVLFFGASYDASLTRDAANTLAQRNSTAAQTFRVYNTYTDASNYERLNVGWEASGSLISFTAAGTGNSAQTIRIFSNGAILAIGSSGGFTFGSAGANWWSISSSGNLTASTDNTYDIGAVSATRPRSVYVGTSITPGRGVTVASLPTPTTGMVARVTDALAPAIGTTVAGGGAAYALVNYNGANWTVIGV
jgi:hypothetical protein